MKIGEVQVGCEYGAVDEPTKRYSSIIPRRVLAQEIITVEEGYWAAFSSDRKTRMVRRVKVKVLDEKPNNSGRWGNVLTVATKGSVLDVEARKLVAPWSELSPAILKRAEEEAQRTEKQAEIERRLKALGFKQIGYGDVHVTVRNNGCTEVEFNDKHVDRLLMMLEGK